MTPAYRTAVLTAFTALWWGATVMLLVRGVLELVSG